MNIDWDKAPEGATHYYKDSPQPWRDLSGYNWKYFSAGEWHSGPSACTSAELMRGLGKVLFARPLPQTWTGEGLPPVGTVCEFMKHNSPPAPKGQWTVGEIRYVSDCTVIIGGDKCEHVHHPLNCSFRPVRTPEHIAEEARQAAITVIENRIMARMGDLNVRNLAEDLHALLQEMAVKP